MLLDLHQRRRLVHLHVVDRPPTQHRRARLGALPEHGAGIAPEVFAVGEAPAAIRIAAAAALPLAGLAARGGGAPSGRRFDKSVDAEQLAPLLEPALPVAMSVSVTASSSTASGAVRARWWV